MPMSGDLKLELDDAAGLDWNRAIEIFAARIQSPYLEPVDLLIEADESRSPIERRYGLFIFNLSTM